MNPVWFALLWRCLPRDTKGRVLYTIQLESDLLVEMPVATKRRFSRHAQSILWYPTLVETGTLRGDTARYAADLFQAVHTIELDPDLADQARRGLSELPNVPVHQGDSGKVFPELLTTIGRSRVFWLDGHYSGGRRASGDNDTPIVAELGAIAARPVRPRAILIG